MYLKKLFLILFVIQFTIVIGLGILTLRLFWTENELSRSRDIHFRSWLLADELRQSSDDLTRMARTYVATGNDEYERQYWAVLDIRNGKSPRPIKYNNIYWDLVTAQGQKPRENAETISLHDLMIREGFTSAEFDKLTVAQKNSDELVNVERIAMNAVKGLFDDGAGNFTVKKKPDRELAIRLMNDEAYHNTKASIMKPIDEFYLMFENRTAKNVAIYERQSMNLLLGILVFIIVMMGIFVFSFVMIVRQINKREQSEEVLRESEEKFRNIFEESPIGIELYDARGRLVASNKASLDMFGIHDDSASGFNLFGGISLDEELKQKLRRGETITYQATFDFDRVRELDQYNTSRTGKAEMEYIITPLKTHEKEDLLGYLLQVQEITERKKAEKVQQVLFNISNAVVTTSDVEELIGIIHEQLGTLVDTTNFYVAFYDEQSGMLTTPYTKDQKDSLTSWPAAKSMTGCVILQNKPILATREDVREMIRSGIIEMFGIPSACWLGVPLRVYGKVIGAFVVQSYDNPNAYSGKDMELLEFVSGQISLSIQRKRAEHDLISAKEKAQESDRLKSAFLANMSHEIRTPMNAIVGFAGMISEPELSEEDRNKFSAIIQSRSNDLMHIINDLLEISRIESGNAVVVKEQIFVNAVIDEMETVFRQKLKGNVKTNILLTCEKVLPDNQATIKTDGFILKQVFTNLIDNAIKYIESGSIRFGYYPPVDGTITFYVADTGIGISTENQKVIFEHFRQAEIPDPHQYGGTGLGLSICKGLLALLGGKIWVESEPGKGSTFYFTLPFEKHAPVTEIEETHPSSLVLRPSSFVPRPSSLATFNWSGKKILLVEDDTTNMEFLKVILGQTHAELISAYSGKELREQYENLDRFDLVLLDVRLPDASGWELAGEIKTLLPGLPLIAQTAYAMSTDKKKSEEAGCDNYISKPIRKEALLAMMSKYLAPS